MKLIRKTGSILSLGGLVFLLVLFIFEDRLQVPSWLQVVGRMHPLLLHFPIVLLIISIISYWIPANKTSQENGWELIRLFAALTAIASAVMGMLLSIEQSNKGDMLYYHKWGGVSIALIAWLLYSFHSVISSNMVLAKSISVVTAFILLVTGHWGANLSHGENFLTEPIMASQKKSVALEEARMFPDIIFPVFKEKCGGCHQARNQKGGLSLNDSAEIVKGGKSGNDLVPGDLIKSLLIHRIHLPLTDKKHMPLAEKPQLSAEEISLLDAWVKAGAPFKQKLTDRPETDSLRLLAYAYIKPQLNTEQEVVYHFTAADPSIINKLNNNYRVIKQLGKNSPALSVSFFGRAMYTPEKLKELEPIKQQIIHLNLAKMPVADQQVNWISSLPNLLRLNLNYSDITDQSMKLIAGMKNLESVSVAGTQVSIQGLNVLLTNKKLKELFIWNSKVKAEEANALQQKNKQLKIENGFQGADTMIVALNQPLIKTPAGFFYDSQKIELAHVIKGATIRYTMDGTEPDSSKSPVYTGPLTIIKTTSVTVKAYKKGWLSSTVVKSSYIKAGIPILKTILQTPVDPKYNLLAEKVLADLDLGDPTDFSTKWLGYQKNNALVILDLGSLQKVKEVMVNTLHSIGSFIFPPVSLTVWGSTDQKNWKLLNTINPEMPKKIVPAIAYLHSLHFKPVAIRYLKLSGQPIKKLPLWHPGKGKPGWFFMSEIVVY